MKIIANNLSIQGLKALCYFYNEQKAYEYHVLSNMGIKLIEDGNGRYDSRGTAKYKLVQDLAENSPITVKRSTDRRTDRSMYNFSVYGTQQSYKQFFDNNCKIDLDNHYAANFEGHSGAEQRFLISETFTGPEWYDGKRIEDIFYTEECSYNYRNKQDCRFTGGTIKSLYNRGLVMYTELISYNNYLYRSTSLDNYGPTRSIIAYGMIFVPKMIAELLQLDTIADMMLSPDTSNRELAHMVAKSQKLLANFTTYDTYDELVVEAMSLPGVREAQMYTLHNLKMEIYKMGVMALHDRYNVFNYYEFITAIGQDYNEFVQWAVTNANPAYKHPRFEELLMQEKDKYEAFKSNLQLQGN